MPNELRTKYQEINPLNVIRRAADQEVTGAIHQLWTQHWANGQETHDEADELTQIADEACVALTKFLWAVRQVELRARKRNPGAFEKRSMG